VIRWIVAVCTCLALGVLLPHASDAQQAASSAVATLGPGDGLRLRIYREPDLSGEYVVDERGVVVLPKIGEWRVTGIPADSVRGAIRVALRQFLSTESIEITPFRRIAVTGAVQKPGLYPVDPSMSVADALILAGGVTPLGKERVIELRMAGAQAGTGISAETRVWDTGAGGTKQLHVPQKPWVQRNGTLLVSLSLSTVTAIGWLLQMSR
jgi:protein involved in polysaccharide export with SLBB domain